MKHTLLSFVFVLTFSFSAFAGECISGDCRNGYGTYGWDDGSIYIGEFRNSNFNGSGTLTFGNNEWKGDKYVGEFKDDIRFGYGTYYYADGNQYVGEFKNGEMHGLGTFTFADGEEMYVGE